MVNEVNINNERQLEELRKYIRKDDYDRVAELVRNGETPIRGRIEVPHNNNEKLHFRIIGNGAKMRAKH